MDPTTIGFPAEYLGEVDIARMQLLALADAAPQATYDWSPAVGARSFSAVLVHIAAVNFGLLRLAGAQYPESADFYGDLQSADPAQLAAMIRRNLALEQSVAGKAMVIAFLQRSFELLRQSFSAADLDRPVEFLGQPSTVRRLYLRMLIHTHEHLGQAIAYARVSGMPIPWPDPLSALDAAAAAARA